MSYNISGAYETPNHSSPDYGQGVGQSPGDYSGGSSGGGGGGNRNNSYQAELERYLKEQQDAAEAARQARQGAANQSAKQATGNLNTATSEALRQAYIQNELAKMNNTQAGAITGYGGVSETSMMGQQANYQNSRSALEAERLAQLSAIEQQRAEGNAQAEVDYNNLLYNTAQQGTQMEYDRWMQEEAARQQQALLEQELAAKMAQKQYAGGGGSSGGGSSGGGGSSSGKDEYGLTQDAYVKALRSTYVKNWLEKLKENQRNNPPATEEGKYEEQAYALQSAGHQGKFTANELAAMSKNLGIPPGLVLPPK